MIRWLPVQALGVLERAQNAGVPPNAYMRNIALSALGKCGRWLEAERLFNSMPAPDTIAHETLMAAYSLSGQAERAERLFERMLRSGHQPRDYAYCSLIAGHRSASKACMLSQHSEQREIPPGREQSSGSKQAG